MFRASREELEPLAREGDRIVRRRLYVLERACRACGAWFSPGHADARFCPANRCKQRRRQRRAAKHRSKP
jgi:rRNA maturation protein Nop10